MMKCNNTKCKYYEPGFTERFLGMQWGKDSGCKFSYCKVKGRKARR